MITPTTTRSGLLGTAVPGCADPFTGRRCPMRIRGAVAAAVVLTVLAGCDDTAVSRPSSSTAAPYVSDGPVTVTLDHPITRKRHFPPGTWSSASPEHERWDFCFDQADGAWSCIPVSAADYRLYEVGDRVQLRQESGQLAVISNH